MLTRGEPAGLVERQKVEEVSLETKSGRGISDLSTI